MWHCRGACVFPSRVLLLIHVLCASMFFLEKDLKTKCVVEMEGNQTFLHSAVTNMNKGDPRWAPAFILLSNHWSLNHTNCLNFEFNKYFLTLTTTFTSMEQNWTLSIITVLEIADSADFCHLNMNHVGVELDNPWMLAIYWDLLIFFFTDSLLFVAGLS